MRLGTWNMADHWSGAHREFLRLQACDVWLLTEVHPAVEIRGMSTFSTVAPMGSDKTLVAVFIRLPPDRGSRPHSATACAYVGGVRSLSSVLPWRTRGPSLVLAAREAAQRHAAFAKGPRFEVPEGVAECSGTQWLAGQRAPVAAEGLHRWLQQSTQRMFTARAMTRVARIKEISDSEIIIIFAHLRMANTSVGPNAVAVLKDSAR